MAKPIPRMLSFLALVVVTSFALVPLVSCTKQRIGKVTAIPGKSHNNNNEHSKTSKHETKAIAERQLQTSYSIHVQQTLVYLYHPIPINITFPVENLYGRTKIVSSAQLNDVNRAIDYFETLGFSDGNPFVIFNWRKLIDPKSMPVYGFGLNLTVLEWDKLGPFHIVLVNETGTKSEGTLIAAQSQPFHVGVEEQPFFTEQSFYPGQKIVSNFVIHPSTISNTFFDIKVFEVTSSYASELHKFNNATMVYQGHIRGSSHNITISWAKPGLYQVVMYTIYNNVIIDVSNVFELKRIDSLAQVTTDNTSYHFAQNIMLTIARPNGTSFDSLVYATVRPSLNVSTAYEMKYGFPTVAFQWNASSRTMEIPVRLRELGTRGTYKAIVFIGSDKSAKYLGVSKAFQVKPPLIRISMPKRVIYQGERVVVDVYSPYYNYNNGYTGTQYKLIPPNGSKAIDATLPYLYAALEPGTYKFAIYDFFRVQPSPFNYIIPNSTFRVARSKGIVVTDKSSYKVGETIAISISSTSPLSLSGTFRGWVMPKPLDGYRGFNVEFNDGGNTINTTKIVDWKNPGTYYLEVSLTHIYYFPVIWSLSLPFNITA